MENGGANGASKRLSDNLFFARLCEADPTVSALVEQRYKLKQFLGAAAIGDALTVVRSLLAAVRTHLEDGAAFVAVGPMGLLDMLLPENNAPERVADFITCLPVRRSLTLAERASIVADARRPEWLGERLRVIHQPEAINCGVLRRKSAPSAEELVGLYQDFVDCRTLLLDTVALYPRRPHGWESRHREISVVDFLNVRLIMSRAPSGVLAEPEEPDVLE